MTSETVQLYDEIVVEGTCMTEKLSSELEQRFRDVEENLKKGSALKWSRRRFPRGASRRKSRFSRRQKRFLLR